MQMRLNVVDIIKGIAIIMIVNVHLISGQFFPIGGTFHVIAFFFTSGIIHGVNEKWKKMSVSTFFQQKITRLLYPFITLSICYICFHLLLNVIRGDLFFNIVIKDCLIQTITFRGIGTLWFLPILFIGEIVFFITKKNKISDWKIIVVGLSAIALSSYLNRKGVCGIQWYGNKTLYGLLVNNPTTIFLAGIIAFFFIEIGFITYKKIPNYFIKEVYSNKKMLQIVMICVISLMIDLFCLQFYEGDLHKLNIGNPFIYLICSFSGIIFVCTISIIIERFLRYIPSILLYFGKNSLIIMTTHTEYYINTITYVGISGLSSVLGFCVSNKLLSGVSLIIIMIIEIGIVYTINHSFLKYLYIMPKRK